MKRERKTIGKVYKIGKDYIKLEIFDKDMQMLMKGWVIEYKPKGILSKLLWRFIRFKVEYRKADNLWSSLPKCELPKFKYNIRDIK